MKIGQPIPGTSVWGSARALAACLAAAACLATTVKAYGEGKTMNLNANWYVRQLEAGEADIAALTREAASPGEAWMAADMPAQVHDVLLRHGKIPDPHIGKNAAASAWVGEKDWVYACRFATPERRADTPAFLELDGVDTLATVCLNGTELARFDNMYRRFRVDVTDSLAPAGNPNALLILFDSPLAFLRGVSPRKGVVRHHYLRKCHSDFGSYLGASPHSVKVGVFADVRLRMPDVAWFEDVWVRSELTPALDRGTLRIVVETGGADASLQWRVKAPAGHPVAEGKADVRNGRAELEITMDHPQLWWPRTHGDPALYTFESSLTAGGRALDARTTAFGVRRITPVLSDPSTGEKRFRFDVNGQAVFLRGACWAPVEGMTHCWRRDRAAKLLDLLEHACMNVLRIWGEGSIPPREFYAECDRRGILVWQDFMFGYGMHPAGDAAYDANCRAEIEDMLRRLRNHPSILLWCGGNENHMGWDFRYGTAPATGNELFGVTMPQAVAQLDPDRLFHPSSPYGGRVPNWPLEGDWHDYSTLQFCPEASVPLYASEVGRASAPSVSSMRRFLSEDELWPEGFDPVVRTPGKPAWPPMWQYRSVGGSWDKVGRVEQYCEPGSAEDLVRVLGTAHGEYLRDRVERQRRGVPDGTTDANRRCWGNMVWRLNDAWPIVYWSVVDYYLEPKIAYYHLRRAYDPVLVSFERTADRIAVWVVNDSPEAVAGTLTLRRRRFDGREQGRLEDDVALAPGESKRCLVATELGPIRLRDEFLHATFSGRDATLLLIGDRFLHLPRAQLEVQRVKDRLEIQSDTFARQVTLEMEGVTGAVFEDNCFDLVPGRKRSIGIIDPAGGQGVLVQALNSEAVRLKLTP